MGSNTPATTTQTGSGTSTADPWAAATPLLNNLIGSYTGTSTALTPAQQAAGTALTSSAAGIPNLSPQATQAVQSMFSNAGMLPANWSQVQSNLSPIAGMSANPYTTPGFSDALNTMTQDITNTVKGEYAGSGRSPSGAGEMPQTLARGLMQGEAPVLQSQYNANIGNILGANQQLTQGAIGTSGGESAATMAALQGAGAIPGIQMAPATAQWGAANAVQGQPIANINELMSPAATLAGLGGTTTTQQQQLGTQTPANNVLSNVLGGISGAAGLVGAFSDRRIKKNIKDIGRTHDNQKIYSFRYKGSNMPQLGMMADEVEKRTPEAVQPDPATGFKRVRYDQATRKAAQMGMQRAY